MQRIPDYRYTSNVKRDFFKRLFAAQKTYGAHLFVLYEPAEERAWFFEDEDMAETIMQANARTEPSCVKLNTSLFRWKGHQALIPGESRELVVDFVKNTSKVSTHFQPDLYFLMRV